MLLAISSSPSSIRSSHFRTRTTPTVSKSLPIKSPFTTPRPPKMNNPSSTPSNTTAPLIPDKILPNLYLSDLHTACAVLSPNYNAPNRPKIRYVLSVIDNPDKQPKVPAGREGEFVLKFISMRDHGNNDLLKILEEASTFIKEGLAHQDEGGVLVHCQKGISRSASVVIAFVMEEMNLDFDTALRYVRGGRSKVKPNSGFQKQLELWGQMRYSIHNAEGKEKAEYVAWKAANDEEITRLNLHQIS